MRVHSETKTSADGLRYSVRYLLTADELAGLRSAGLIGDADEVIGLQDVADGAVAMLERDLHGGAAIQ